MFQPGERIAERFEVEALLGEGGLAQVYRVRHTTLGTTHALKLLTMSHASLVERLLQEGRIQAQLRHPNIVGVSDVITVRGMPGLLLEYVDCETLEVALNRDGRMPLEEALDLFAAVLSGVATAHQAGVLHRDLKPANILLARTSNGIVPKVSDFGIAKIAAGDSHPGLTRAGSAMGTPGYVAPEQMEDASNVDLRADIFSLGTILYELVIGKRAFPSKSMRETLNAAASGQYTPPEEEDPSLPAPVVRSINKALRPEPEDRFVDCVAFAESLFVDQPGRLALIKSRSGAPGPAAGTLIGRSTSTWTPTPSTRRSGDDTRSAETLAPASQEISRITKRPTMPGPPPLARWLLIIGLGGLTLIAMLVGGLLIGSLIKGGPIPGFGRSDGDPGAVSDDPGAPVGEDADPASPTSTVAPAEEAGSATPSAEPSSAPPAEAGPTPDEAGSAPAETPPPSAEARPASDTRSSGGASTASGGSTTSGASATRSTPKTTASAESSPWTTSAPAETPTSASTSGAASASSAAAEPSVMRLVGTWTGDPWRITILDQEGTKVGGYIYRGSTGTRIEVDGTFDPGTNTLSLVDHGQARWRLTGTVEGRWWRGTYTQGQGEITTPFSARRTR